MEKIEDIWLVLQAEECETDEAGGLWTAATPFRTFEGAKAYLEEIVRTEWCAVARTKNDGGMPLANVKGMAFPEGTSVKHALAYYDKDGTEAWVASGYDGFGKKAIIVKLGKEGVRRC